MSRAKYIGFINVYKPKGISSFDVIRRLRRILKVRDLGHGGTLDPFAEGVLPIAQKPITRLFPYINDIKSYEFSILLGKTSDTDDVEGKILTDKGCLIEKEKILSSLDNFRGKFKQVPPRYSSVKVNGKKAYKLARENKDFKLEPKEVEIFKLDLLDYTIFKEKYILIKLKALCSRGTYIRALARDLGELLGCGGMLYSLKRLQSGPFTVSTAQTLDDIKESGVNLLLVSKVLNNFAQALIKDEFLYKLLYGQVIKKFDLQDLSSQDDNMLLIKDKSNRVIALAKKVSDRLYQPFKVLRLD